MNARVRLVLLGATLVASSAASGLPRSQGEGGIVLVTVVDAPDGGRGDASAADASAQRSSGATQVPDAPVDAGPPKDGGAASAGEGVDAGAADPCGSLADRVERRRAWLKARREEQFAQGGMPDPERGVPNVIGVWCERHPGHEECVLGSAAVATTTEELAWGPDKTPEDFDAHVLLMRRALKACRDKATWRW